MFPPRLSESDMNWHRQPHVAIDGLRLLVAEMVGCAVNEYRALRKAGIIVNDQVNRQVPEVP